MGIGTQKFSLSKTISQPPDSEVPKQRNWKTTFLSPLGFCLLLALAVRVLLVVRSQGFVEGDEVLIGIQAQHILHGELPIYFYGQPYMGSLEAYLVAVVFAIFGSSDWTLRIEPTILSVVLVGLAWKLACVLADEVGLPPRAKRYFAFIVALITAVPPLYDIIPQLRTWGGYPETFNLILLLFICVLRLTQRWKQEASRKELTWRWAGIGFIIGLGFWIYPLIISAVATSVIWLFVFCIARLVKNHVPRSSFKATFLPLKDLLLALIALPAALFGFTPGLIWGAMNGWANISYVVGVGSNISDRWGVVQTATQVYATCVIPHVLSGSLPVSSPLQNTPLENTSPQLHLALFIGGVVCIAIAVLACLLSFFWRSPLFTQARKPTALALLFALWTSISFVAGKNADEIQSLNCNVDHIGRYATPLVLVLPFLYATALVLCIRLVQKYVTREREAELDAPPPVKPRGGRQTFLFLPQILLFLVLASYAGVQLWTYQAPNGAYIFESPYCHEAPVSDTLIVQYLERHNVHYAWSTNWIGYRIVFETQGRIIVADATAVVPPYADSNRIPAQTNEVINAVRPALIIFIAKANKNPVLLKDLRADGVIYKEARFNAMPGYQILVVLPQNRSVSPLTSAAIAKTFKFCAY
jgi:hypothetical protein